VSIPDLPRRLAELTEAVRARAIDRTAHVLGKLPVVELDHVRTTGERVVESRRGKVNDHRDAGGPDIGDHRLADRVGQALGRERIAHHEHRALKRRGAGRGHEVVHFGALRRRTIRDREDPALAGTAVDHVAAARPRGADDAPLTRQRVQQRRQSGAGLAAHEATQHRAGAELARHARDPDSLAGGVDMDIILVAATFDRDAEHGIRREHREGP